MIQPVQADLGTDTQPSPLRRIILPGVVLVCFFFGVWMFLPLIEEEHKRLEPPFAIGLWAGDIVAAFWCLQYIVIPCFVSMRRSKTLEGILPWWSEYHQIMPLLVVSLVLVTLV